MKKKLYMETFSSRSTTDTTEHCFVFAFTKKEMVLRFNESHYFRVTNFVNVNYICIYEVRYPEMKSSVKVTT